MSVFADASALVKLYADEAGSDTVRALEVVVVSDLARVEVPSALWRKQRMAELEPEDAAILVREFEADLLGTAEEAPRFASITVTGAVLAEAARLVAVHGLRAYDAVQLASALLARAADPSCLTLSAFDHALRGAAAAEGFVLVPATR